MEVRNNFWLLTGTPFSGSCISRTRLSICHQQQVIELKGCAFCFVLFLVLTVAQKMPQQLPPLDDGWGVKRKMDVAGVDVKSHEQQLNQRSLGLARSINCSVG